MILWLAIEASACDAPPAQRKTATQRGVSWIVGYLEDEARLADMGIDGMVLFAELAQTASDPVVAEASRVAAERAAAALRAQLEKKVLLWDAPEVIDALELMTHMRDLGLKTTTIETKLQTSMLLRRRVRYLCGVDNKKLDQRSTEDLYALMMCAYVAERARRYEPELVPTPIAVRPVLEALDKRWPTANRAPNRDLAYTATHQVLVASDYGRRNAPADSPVIHWLEETHERWLKEGDVELIGEYVDALRLAGKHHSDVVKRGTCALLDAQNGDGSWGKPHDAGSTYAAIHPTWCALVALVDRHSHQQECCQEPTGSGAAQR